MPRLTTAGAVDYNATGVITLPVLQLDGVGIQANGAAITLPLLAVSGTIVSGNVISGAVSLALLQTDGLVQRGTSGAITLPLLEVSGTAGVQGLVSGNIILPSLLVSGAVLAAAAVEVTTDYVVWVVNTETKAHSTYTNWQASSLTEFNGKWFIALPDGLYELTGTADGATAIDAAVYWPLSEFGTSKQKRLDAAYVHLRQSGDFKLVAICDETQKRIYGQDMTGFPTGLHPKRVQFTRGLKGRNWQIGFENTNGADFDLAEIELVTIPESRRLK